MRFLDDCGFREAVAALTGERLASEHKPPLHQPKPVRQERSVEQYKSQQRDKARHLWRASQAAPGTVADAYLRTRGYFGSLPVTVRFLPPVKPAHHPAMIIYREGSDKGKHLRSRAGLRQ